MRNFYILLLLVSAQLSAQHKIASQIRDIHRQGVEFAPVSPFFPVSQPSDVSKAVTKASFAVLNKAAVEDVFRNQHEAIELEIPYLGQLVKVEMFKVNLFHDGFHLDTDQSANVSYSRGLHYRGIVKGDANSVASFNFFPDDVNGIISDATRSNLVVGRLQNDGSNDFIIYSDADLMIANGFECHVRDDDAPTGNAGPMKRSVQTERCVTTYFEVDHDLYLAHNSNITLTTNWMTSVFNNVQTLFANDGITVALRSVFIWTTPDPYFGESSHEYLFQFNQVRPVFDGDVGQLVGIDPGGLGGVAVTTDGLCSQNNFSYSDLEVSFTTVPTWSWTVQVITHELGHLFGSPHTHACVWNGDDTAIDGCGTQAGYEEGDCPIGPIPSPAVKGTIMSYCHVIGGVGINFANGFGTQPAQRIIENVESSLCLSVDCVSTCINTVAALEASNITPTSATISWTDVSENPANHEITVYPVNSPNPGFQSVEGTSLQLTSLQPNTFYRVRIRPVCDNITAMARETIFATSADWCSGITITDTGGENQNYTNMEHYVRTLIPTLPNKKIRIDFQSFNVEAGWDFVYIYDGLNTDAPEITGGLTGTGVPGPFVSSVPGGALTLEFISDEFVTRSGYVATVSCEELLGTNEFGDVIDFTYYPNPTTGTVKISSNTLISEIQVFNIESRLLHKNVENSFETQVNMENFATGTYFFKIKFGLHEANIKILKN